MGQNRWRVGLLAATAIILIAAGPASAAPAKSPKLQVGVGRADITPPTSFNLTGSLDPQLYAFEVHQLSLAIRRADANLGPGKVGWGFTTIDDLTKNRSIEAHLADHGMNIPYGHGSASMDPDGPLHP